MAYVQYVPKPNALHSFTIRDFSGGMNNRSDQLNENEASVIQNLKFSDDHVLETRFGQKYYDDIELDSAVVFIDEYRPYNDDNQLIRATTSKIYFGSNEYSIFGAPSGVNHQGKYYFADGDKLRVYGNFNDVASTYTELIGTPIVGYDVYEITQPPSDYIPLDSTHTRGKKVINYTDKKVWYEPCDNEMTDALKGSNIPTPGVKYIVSHGDRLFMSGYEDDDDNVFISDIINPLYYPVALPIQLPPTSEKVSGLYVFDDAVIVGRQTDIYAIRGKTNKMEIGLPMFQLKKLNTHTGFASHHAIDIAHNYLIFLGQDGNVYAMQSSTTDLRELATVLISRSIDIFKSPINASREDLIDSASFFFNDEWYLSVGDKVMVYNYRHMSWVMFTGFNSKCFFGKDDNWIWGMNNGRIATFDKDAYYDFGEPFQSMWYSRNIDLSTPATFKYFKEIFLIAHTFEVEYSDINLTFEIDYAGITDRIIISNQLSVWGKSMWGDKFINKNINESAPFILGRRGRNIKIKITNNYDIHGEVDEYSDLENYEGKRDGVLVKVGGVDYYVYQNYQWEKVQYEALNQKMKIYQINGYYEMRGNR